MLQKRISCAARGACLLVLGLATVPIGGAPADETPVARIVGAALVESQAYDKLTYLGDRIGHRLSGSEALEQAIEWAVKQYERDGIEHAWTEKVMVPHWVRGEEQAWIVAPRKSKMSILALGGSVGTPEQGLTAEVIEVEGFEELEAVGDAVQGKIVLFNRPIEPGFGSEHGYGSAVRLRGDGPSRAAALGAVGMLIRSLGTANYRLPHTGALRYAEDVRKIPAAAVSAEDAEMIERLLASGVPVQVHMELGAHTLPDAESANVIAEIRGRERPEEIVLIACHLDSWDVGHGAHDDGAGCVVVMETLRLLNKLGLVPRRTLRGVLFTNEENGLRGGRDYAERHADEHHVAAIEMDGGAMAPRGFGVTAGEGGLELARRLAEPLAVIDADEIFPRGGGADIGPLKKQGVPVMALVVDSATYFDYHHSAADTVDKVDRRDLDRNVAAMALMSWGLAESAETLPRVEVEPASED